MVVSHLRALRLDTTQAQAFRNKVEEIERQNENYRRQVGLYGLCLTCKKLNWLATPTLYSSVVGSTTHYGKLAHVHNGGFAISSNAVRAIRCLE